MNEHELYKDIDIHHPHDSFFHKIFDSLTNTRAFLEKILPPKLSSRIDFSTIEVEPTIYVNNQFLKGASDIVVKVLIAPDVTDGNKRELEILLVIEHKSESKDEIFIQVLKYMVFEWEKDYNNKKPPRLIIPVVFYNGTEEWKVPHSFLDQFDVDFSDDLKQYLLDFSYILFDTHHWDYKDESNKALRENVYLFSSMVLMKLAHSNDIESIGEIFRLWAEKGFPNNDDLLGFFLRYIFATQDVTRDMLEKITRENILSGGEIMPTLAERLIKEGEEKGKEEGKKEGKEEVAYKLYEKGLSLDLIMETTGLSWSEVNKIAQPRVEYGSKPEEK